MSSVLVTGAGGFIGHEVCARLVRAGFSVTGVIRRRRLGGDIALRDVSQRTVVDLAIDGSRAPFFAGVDTVVHLAARVHHVGERGDVAERRYERENTLLTTRLAEAAAQARVRRFVFMSSIKAVCERSAGQPIGPDAEPKPEDAYGRSKLGAERALRDIGAAAGIEIIILRPPLVYGPAVGANFRHLANWIKRGLPLPFASITNRRSLISVWNLADAVVQSCRIPPAAARVFHVSDDRPVSTPELARLIAAGLRRRPRLFAVPPTLLRRLLAMSGRETIADRLVGSLELDTRESLSELGAPKMTVDEGVVKAARELKW